MARRLGIFMWFLAALWLSPGCVIGTWPTPEGRSSEDVNNARPNRAPSGDEACDGHDDDADGAVDEGCPCEEEAVRGCRGVDEGLCGHGVQRCISNIWQECSNLGPPFVDALDPTLSIVSFTPDSIAREESSPLSVQMTATAACSGIEVPRVQVILQSRSPVMSVKGFAADDGVAGDQQAGDGIYTVELVPPFGPGVAGQTLLLRASFGSGAASPVVEEELELTEASP